MNVRPGRKPVPDRRPWRDVLGGSWSPHGELALRDVDVLAHLSAAEVLQRREPPQDPAQLGPLAEVLSAFADAGTELAAAMELAGGRAAAGKAGAP